MNAMCNIKYSLSLYKSFYLAQNIIIFLCLRTYFFLFEAYHFFVATFFIISFLCGNVLYLYSRATSMSSLIVDWISPFEVQGSQKLVTYIHTHTHTLTNTHTHKHTQKWFHWNGEKSESFELKLIVDSWFSFFVHVNKTKHKVPMLVLKMCLVIFKFKFKREILLLA